MSAPDRLLASLDDPRPRLIAADQEVSFAELGRRARRFAAGLRAAGVAPGDRVAALARPSVDLVVANLGCYLAGAIYVPINTRYRGGEVEHILTDSGARAAVVDADGAALLGRLSAAASPIRIGIDGAAPELADAAPAAAPELADETPAMLIYTSGTTGKSKGVTLSYRAVVGAIDALTGLWGWTERDRLSLMLPLFHVHGLGIGIHGALLRRVDVLLHRSFSVDALVDDVRDRGATIFMGVPTMYRMILDRLEDDPAAADALRGARLFTSGSAPLPAADHARFRELTGHDILERYGMSETLLTLSNPLDGERRPGSVGMPVPGFEVAIVRDDGSRCDPGETGEIRVRGVGLMSGYWGNPEATAREYDGDWFKTGDVAYVDDDGYVHIVGRKSVDIIKSGGFKVSAREIEELLVGHPQVREVAVVGLPDPTWGQAIAAAVVADGDPEPAELERELVELASRELADYKKPRRVILVDELPRNALGKLQKHRITGLF